MNVRSFLSHLNDDGGCAGVGDDDGDGGASSFDGEMHLLDLDPDLDPDLDVPETLRPLPQPAQQVAKEIGQTFRSPDDEWTLFEMESSHPRDDPSSALEAFSSQDSWNLSLVNE
jgi:hypothetical protein